MNENYRKFHSGRFGPEGMINPDFATQVQSGSGFKEQGIMKKKMMNEDQISYQEDIKKGVSIPGMEGE